MRNWLSGMTIFFGPVFARVLAWLALNFIIDVMTYNGHFFKEKLVDAIYTAIEVFVYVALAMATYIYTMYSLGFSTPWAIVAGTAMASFAFVLFHGAAETLAQLQETDFPSPR